MKEIEQLAIQFRKAMDRAFLNGEFENDTICFFRFPHGCCGDASYLLAKYLLDHGIETQYVCGTHYVWGEEEYPDSQSHAWLLDRGENIIDITGDQFSNDSEYNFYNLTTYYGKLDEFHNLFEVEQRDIHGYFDISADSRLMRIYKAILKYL